jgi:Flp pilus assembly protein TadG
MIRRKQERGSAILEFAIAASVFVALFTGTFQYGYSFYVYNNLETAIRAGARYGALRSYPVAGETVNNSPSSAFVTDIQNVVVWGNPGGQISGTSRVVRDIDVSNVRVDVTFQNNQPNTVTVAIQNYTINSVFGTWTLNRKPSATFTFMSIYQPPVV